MRVEHPQPSAVKQLIPIMNLRAILLCGALSAATLPAADTLTREFQRALFEEEANRNLPAAIAGYEAVIKRLDEQRQLAATAVFRLGESYRKLGKTNEAVAAYERIIKEFADQETLVKLSGQNLSILRPERAGASEGWASGLMESSTSTDAEAHRFAVVLETIRGLEPNSEEEIRTLASVVPESGLMEVWSHLKATETRLERQRANPQAYRGESSLEELQENRDGWERRLTEKKNLVIRMMQARIDAARRLAGRGDAVSGASGGSQAGGQDASMLALRVEYERLKETLDQLTNNAAPQQAKYALVRGLLPDATLARLDEMAVAARVELAGLSTTYGPEHGDVKAARAKLDELNKSIEERMGAVVLAAQFKLKSLEQSVAVQSGSSSPLTSSTDPATRARQKELLEQEIALVEGQMREDDIRYERGTIASEERIPLQRELLNLRRKVAMLDESPEAINRQRELVDQELALVRQLIDVSKRQLQVGKGSRNDLVELERQMLQLMREDLDLAARPAPNAADRSR
jgi:tetratricopeptide (TPR) repeat protein